MKSASPLIVSAPAGSTVTVFADASVLLMLYWKPLLPDAVTIDTVLSPAVASIKMCSSKEDEMTLDDVVVMVGLLPISFVQT